jgi:TatD DNase family protein
VEWFDSHCHLHLCEDDAPLEAVVEAARAAATSMTTVGIDVGSSRRAVAIAAEFGLWATAGVHPNDAADWNQDAARTIGSLLGNDRVVAVGETGLDFYRDRCPPEQQRRAFKDQIELAKRHGVALVIHTRASVDSAMDCLEEAGPPERFVFHCWSGTGVSLERALDLGAFVSFAGNVSFRSADDLRAAARDVPDNRLLVETDSPFLAPVPHRGRPNEPAFVQHVGRAVAQARGIDVGDLAATTTANARELYGLS